MNDHVHPTMQQALASFDAPRCPAGQFLHVHLHKKLGALDCHLQWDEAAPECGWAEQVTLCAAYMCGREMSEYLPAADVEAIEIEATRQPKEFWEPA